MKNKFLTAFSFALCAALPLSASAAVITSASDASLVGAAVETFDTVTDGNYASLSLPGVTIVGNGAPMTVDATWTSAYGVAGQSLHNSNSSPLSFDIIFDSAVSAFGIWGGAYNNNWTFDAYDASGALIETANITTACCSAQFAGLANAGMSRITLSGFGDWVIFDNLTYTQAQVSEPSSVALILLGLAGLSFSRRKTRA